MTANRRVHPKRKEEFGAWVKRRREGLGLTQEELGRKSGVSTETIRKIETTYKSLPREDTADRLIKILEEKDKNLLYFMSYPDAHSVGEDKLLEENEFDKIDENIDLSYNTKDIFKYRYKSSISSLFIIICLVGVLITILFIYYREPIVKTVSGSTDIFSTDPPRGNIGFQEQDFGWEQGKSIDSHYNLLQSNSIQLTAGGNTEQSPEKGTTAPLIYYRVHGDFEAHVLVSFSPKLICCKHAGMGVRSVPNHGDWIRITKDWANTIQSDVSKGDLSSGINGVKYISDHVYLKIIRNDNRFTLLFSKDNSKWQIARQNYTVDMPKDMEIYLFALSAYDNDSTYAEFSDFSIN